MGTSPKSMAASVLDLLKASPPSMQAWELMKLHLINWIDEEQAELEKWRKRLESAEDPADAGKLYKAKIKLQNFYVLRLVIDGMYDSLLAAHLKMSGMLQDIMEQDRKYLQAQNDLQHFHEETLHMHEHSEMLTNAIERLMAVEEDTTPALMRLMKTSSTFRNGVEVLIANGINTL